MVEFKYKRRRITPEVKVGNVKMGADNPLVAQAMTLTDTSDVNATVQETKELHRAGSSMVRMTVKDRDHARAIPKIRERLDKAGVDVPLIGDFHFEGHKNLSKEPSCAVALAKWRINPGNAGKFDRSTLEKENFLESWRTLSPTQISEYVKRLSKHFHDPDFESFIHLALIHDTPVRIGVNSGSISSISSSMGTFVTTKLMDENSKLIDKKSDHEIESISMALTAMIAVDMARRYGMPDNLMLVSTKSSEIKPMVDGYKMFADRSNIALHVGLTEAGAGNQGVINTTIAQAMLLADGIGDTFRTSLSPFPGQLRSEEVRVQHSILSYASLDADDLHYPYRSKKYDEVVYRTLRAYHAFLRGPSELKTLEFFDQKIGNGRREAMIKENVVEAAQPMPPKVTRRILEALELMPLEYKVTACPGCGRTNRNEFIKLRQAVEDHVKLRKAELANQNIEITDLKIASMGCVVNGPGEAAKADLAFVLPGKGEKPVVMVFRDGKKYKTLKAADYETIRKEALMIVDDYIDGRYVPSYIPEGPIAGVQAS